MSADNYGRRIIYTDVNEITAENVISVLRDAMVVHPINADRCEYLLKYEAGVQPLQRVKTTRKDVDIVCIDNIANQIAEFHESFFWGNAITITQRGENDKGVATESEAINLLNECYDAENIKLKTQQMARFVEICGIGYELIDINADYEDGDSYFNLDVLDPRYSFIVRSSNVGHKPMLGVTFRTDKLGNRFFTCFSKDYRFEIMNQVKILDANGDTEDVDNWFATDGNASANPLGIIPIVEWIRSTDRMGCFERQIPEMDNLNILISDMSNDVDQNTNAIWHMNDCELPKDKTTGEVIRPESGEWLQTQTTRDGKTPFVKPLAVAYDYNGILNNIVTRRALILMKCDVPNRNNDTGGSTGTAMDSATGWATTEANAFKKESIVSGCKMEEIKVVLKAIKNHPMVESDNPILDLRPIDLIPSMKRQKTYEMTTKVNAFCSAIDHGIDYKSMIRAINFFDDPQQVIEDSKETIERYLDKQFGSDKEETEMVNPNADGNAITNSSDDPANQIDNSPLIDGNKTTQTGDEE